MLSISGAMLSCANIAAGMSTPSTDTIFNIFVSWMWFSQGCEQLQTQGESKPTQPAQPFFVQMNGFVLQSCSICLCLHLKINGSSDSAINSLIIPIYCPVLTCNAESMTPQLRWKKNSGRDTFVSYKEIKLSLLRLHVLCIDVHISIEIHCAQECTLSGTQHKSNTQ